MIVLVNHKGRPVPVEQIDDLTLEKHKIVESVLADAFKMNKRMMNAKKRYFKRIDQYLKKLEKKYKTERTGKGNLILTNYSGDRQVEIKINDDFVFDEKLLLAKSKIDSCIKKWSDGSNKNLIALVDNAFNVDKRGQINKHDIIALTKLKFDDAEWNEAVELIRDSMNIVGTKQYLRFRYRSGNEGKWETINLNFSTI